jgi:hypothetical protein
MKDVFWKRMLRFNLKKSETLDFSIKIDIFIETVKKDSHLFFLSALWWKVNEMFNFIGVSFLELLLGIFIFAPVKIARININSQTGYIISHFNWVSDNALLIKCELI